MATVNDILHDVAATFRFKVEIDGILVAGFSEVSGLSMETEVFEYAEGGVNQYVHRFPLRTKHAPLVLKRGITWTTYLWDWYKDVVAGKVKRKNGSIILYSVDNLEIRRWNFYGAFPTKWNGPDLSAESSAVAVESVELTHNGFDPIGAVPPLQKK